jgi:hypothetical protein
MVLLVNEPDYTFIYVYQINGLQEVIESAKILTICLHESQHYALVIDCDKVYI